MANISLTELGAVTSTIDSTIHFFRENNLLKNGKFCERCELWMSHITDASLGDSYVWRCTSCQKKVMIREGSFWEGQKLSLSVYVQILFLFAHNVSSGQAIKMLAGEAGANSIYTWFNFYRDIMSRTLLEAPIRLGGPDTIVEIDESIWGNKRKYNRGRISKTNDWIFGLIQRDTGKVALFIVNNRSAAELIPHIQNIVLPGTTIISDQWAAYNSLNTLGYVHLTVNHSENFVDPATGAHTQTIESFWSHSKAIFKNMRGSKRNQLPAHLDEVMFRWNNKGTPLFPLLLHKIAQFYPCNETVPPQYQHGRPPVVYRNQRQ